MKVNQWDYNNHKGTTTVFKAETEEEMKIIKELKKLIDGNEGVISRKSFTFTDGDITLDINKK